MYNDEDWDKWAEKKARENPKSGWASEQWKDWGKKRQEEFSSKRNNRERRRDRSPARKGYSEERWKEWARQKMTEKPDMNFTEDAWVEWLKKQEERKPRRSRSRGGGRRRGRQEAAPERLAGDCWEEPRAKTQLQLLGGSAVHQSGWTFPLMDESRRSFAGFLRNPFSEAALQDFFARIRDGTTWCQPQGKNGPIPRKTAWMVSPGCSCHYSYGGIDVDPQEYPPWMVALMREVMPRCGLMQQGDWPNSCNVNLYEDGGMSVGWHSDDEDLFQGKFRDIAIISLSLGATRKFELRANWPEEDEKPVRRLFLASGDLMTMEGMLQKHYQHRVPREDNIEGPRINLTWRWNVKHRPQCPAGRTRLGG